MDCRVRLAQIDAQLGDLADNLAVHLEHIERAVADGIELIVFPELSLTGYFLKDQTFEVALNVNSPEIQTLVERSKDISIVVGYVERTYDGRIYNAVALLEDGQFQHVHRKVHLVTYGMFEESRDLAGGVRFDPIETKHGRFGVLVCEDAWHLDGLYLHFLRNCDAMLVPSASPARGAEVPGPGFASERTWNTLLDAAALFTRTWVVYVNRVGFEDGVCFGGGSRVVDPMGNEVARVEGLDAGQLAVRLTAAALDRARGSTPLRRDEKPWLLAQDLADWRQLDLPRENGDGGAR